MTNNGAGEGEEQEVRPGDEGLRGKLESPAAPQTLSPPSEGSHDRGLVLQQATFLGQ